MWRFTLWLTAAAVALLPITAMASPDDRGGAQLAVPDSVTIAQQRQEVSALETQVLTLTAEREDLRGQLASTTAERDQAWAERDRLQGQLTAMSSGRGSGSLSVPVAVHPPIAATLTDNHFSFGYCTWYVANRRPIPWMGDAGQWGPNAAVMGFPEGSTPRPGAVMVTWEGPIGHVAYVESVNGDGSWVVSEMNYAAWDVVDYRTIRPGTVPLETFIY